MRGAFAAFGVGVMDMVVEHRLVPCFGHLEHEVALEQMAHHGGPPRGRHAEIVRQAQLVVPVALSPHEILHDLQKHPASVHGILRVGHGAYFRMQGAQCVEPFFCASFAEHIQQPEHGRGHAFLHRFGKRDDSVGIELGHGEHAGLAPLFHLGDEREELGVLRIVEKLAVPHRITCLMEVRTF